MKIETRIRVRRRVICKRNWQADKQAIDFIRENDKPILRYDKLKSWDADGKELGSRMELANEQPLDHW